MSRKQAYLADYKAMRLSVIIPSLTGEVPRTVPCDSRVEVILVKGMSPVSAACNEGLRRATGDWIAWVDCDDEVLPSWCETILREIDELQDSGIDVLSFGAEMSRGNGKTVTMRYCDERRDVSSMRYLCDILRDIGGCTWLWNKVFRRSLFDGLRFEGPTQEDFRIMPRVLMRARCVRMLPEVLYRYTRPKGSLTHAGGGARNAEGILAAISDGLHDVPCAETIMPFWNEGCAVRAADCIYNSGRNRELMAFLRMNLRSILFDARLGMSVKAKSMRLCWKMTYCPYLRDGRLYTCAQAYHIKDYIKLYETETGNQGKMTASAGLDVHDEANDGWTILRYLMTPCETCRFCADRVRGIPWTQGFRSVRDWEVG